MAEFSAARDPVTGKWGLKQETLDAPATVMFFASEEETLAYVLARIPRELIPRS